jgi:hypothetical protein
MRPRVTLMLLSLVAAMPLAARAAGAQQRDTARTGRAAQPQQQTFRSLAAVTPNRDVVLEVPELAVDSIGLTVANVRAHVALDANAMNLVQVTAGVDVGIQQVQLGIVGVLAEAYLYVDLDNIARIVGRVVQTLDRNPEILTQVLRTVETAATSLTGQQPAAQPAQPPPRTTTPPTRPPQ